MMRTRFTSLACTVLLASCAHAPRETEPMLCGNSQMLYAEPYRFAVEDAADPEPSDISTTLSAIAVSNPSLVWEGEPGASRVRVATWTSWDGYDALVGQPVPLGREAWVTPVPDMQVACRAMHRTGAALAQRLEQLLGLPADNHKTRMVELWVEPRDMFRACIDAEIDDTQCQLEPPADVTDAHRAWFDALRARSYGSNGVGGYPWTQLGYTYDWGSGTMGHGAFPVGLSEYVVRSGASVHVVSVVSTDAYCATSEN